MEAIGESEKGNPTFVRPHQERSAGRNVSRAVRYEGPLYGGKYGIMTWRWQTI